MFKFNLSIGYLYKNYYYHIQFLSYRLEYLKCGLLDTFNTFNLEYVTVLVITNLIRVFSSDALFLIIITILKNHFLNFDLK